MIDWARVSELRDEIGAEDFDEVVEIFLEEVDLAITTLGDGSDTLSAQLHFLKGSALNLGFEEFSALCQSGETRAHSGETDIDLAQIQKAYADSRQEFVSELSVKFAA